MATSLARQLAKLAAPSTSLYDRRRAEKVSFLFDASEAAEFDYDTFLAIGQSGFRELAARSPHLQRYWHSLFSDAIRHYERAVHGTDDNDALNKIIEEFLLEMAPYFLIRPCHKALEWLIQRFHIHTFNVDALMLLALPYHSSNYFVRIVQIVDVRLGDNAKWTWILPVRQSGMPLTLDRLAEFCLADHRMLDVICNHFTKLVIESSDMDDTSSDAAEQCVKFCTVLLHQVLGRARQSDARKRSKVPLNRALQVTCTAISSSKRPSGITAAYTLLLRIFNSYNLDPRIHDAVIDALLQSPAAKEMADTFAVLAALATAQPRVDYEKHAMKLCADEEFMALVRSSESSAVSRLQNSALGTPMARRRILQLAEAGRLNDLSQVLITYADLFTSNMLADILRVICQPLLQSALNNDIVEPQMQNNALRASLRIRKHDAAAWAQFVSSLSSDVSVTIITYFDKLLVDGADGDDSGDKRLPVLSIGSKAHLDNVKAMDLAETTGCANSTVVFTHVDNILQSGDAPLINSTLDMIDAFITNKSEDARRESIGAVPHAAVHDLLLRFLRRLSRDAHVLMWKNRSNGGNGSELSDQSEPNWCSLGIAAINLALRTRGVTSSPSESAGELDALVLTLTMAFPAADAFGFLCAKQSGARQLAWLPFDLLPTDRLAKGDLLGSLVGKLASLERNYAGRVVNAFLSFGKSEHDNLQGHSIGSAHASAVCITCSCMVLDVWRTDSTYKFTPESTGFGATLQLQLARAVRHYVRQFGSHTGASPSRDRVKSDSTQLSFALRRLRKTGKIPANLLALWIESLVGGVTEGTFENASVQRATQLRLAFGSGEPGQVATFEELLLELAGILFGEMAWCHSVATVASERFTRRDDPCALFNDVITLTAARALGQSGWTTIAGFLRISLDETDEAGSRHALVFCRSLIESAPRATSATDGYDLAVMLCLLSRSIMTTAQKFAETRSAAIDFLAALLKRERASWQADLNSGAHTERRRFVELLHHALVKRRVEIEADGDSAASMMAAGVQAKNSGDSQLDSLPSGPIVPMLRLLDEDSPVPIEWKTRFAPLLARIEDDSTNDFLLARLYALISRDFHTLSEPELHYAKALGQCWRGCRPERFGESALLEQLTRCIDWSEPRQSSTCTLRNEMCTSLLDHLFWFRFDHLDSSSQCALLAKIIALRYQRREDGEEAAGREDTMSSRIGDSGVVSSCERLLSRWHLKAETFNELLNTYSARLVVSTGDGDAIALLRSDAWRSLFGTVDVFSRYESSIRHRSTALTGLCSALRCIITLSSTRFVQDDASESYLEPLKHVLRLLQHIVLIENRKSTPFHSGALALVDDVMRCIRGVGARDGEVLRLALGLLQQAAVQAPASVLHQSISLFAFVGRRMTTASGASGSDWSVRTAQQTLTSLIPALLNVCCGGGQADTEKRRRLVLQILETFFDAVPHMNSSGSLSASASAGLAPESSIETILGALLAGIGAEQYLWLFVAMLLRSAVVQHVALSESDLDTRKVSQWCCMKPPLVLCGELIMRTPCLAAPTSGNSSVDAEDGSDRESTDGAVTVTPSVTEWRLLDNDAQLANLAALVELAGQLHTVRARTSSAADSVEVVPTAETSLVGALPDWLTAAFSSKTLLANQSAIGEVAWSCDADCIANSLRLALLHAVEQAITTLTTTKRGAIDVATPSARRTVQRLIVALNRVRLAATARAAAADEKLNGADKSNAVKQTQSCSKRRRGEAESLSGSGGELACYANCASSAAIYWLRVSSSVHSATTRFLSAVPAGVFVDVGVGLLAATATSSQQTVGESRSLTQALLLVDEVLHLRGAQTNSQSVVAESKIKLIRLAEALRQIAAPTSGCHSDEHRALAITGLCHLCRILASSNSARADDSADVRRRVETAQSEVLHIINLLASCLLEGTNRTQPVGDEGTSHYAVASLGDTRRIAALLDAAHSLTSAEAMTGSCGGASAALRFTSLAFVAATQWLCDIERDPLGLREALAITRSTTSGLSVVRGRNSRLPAGIKPAMRLVVTFVEQQASMITARALARLIALCCRYASYSSAVSTLDHRDDVSTSRHRRRHKRKIYGAAGLSSLQNALQRVIADGRLPLRIFVRALMLIDASDDADGVDVFEKWQEDEAAFDFATRMISTALVASSRKHVFGHYSDISQHLFCWLEKLVSTTPICGGVDANLLMLYRVYGSFALSLSGALFQRMLTHLLDWEALDDAPSGTAKDALHGRRNTVVLALMGSLSEQLRGAFIPFCLPLFERCLSHLGSCGSAAEANVQRDTAIARLLSNIARHDGGDGGDGGGRFYDRPRLEALLKVALNPLRTLLRAQSPTEKSTPINLPASELTERKKKKRRAECDDAATSSSSVRSSDGQSADATTSDAAIERLADELCALFVELVRSAADSSDYALQELNGQLCELLSDDDMPRGIADMARRRRRGQLVQMAALRCIAALMRNFSTEYEALLPDTAGALHQAMEECASTPALAAACHETISEAERILGQPLTSVLIDDGAD